MDLSTQRRCLGAITGGLLLGAVGAVAWSFSGIDPSDINPRSRSIRPRRADTAAVERRVLEDRIAAQSLRAPLYDPPPPPVRAADAAPRREPASPPTAPLEVTLVGTIIQTDQNLAILADSSGKFDVKGIGETLELSPQGITVENIKSEQVTLRFQGRQSTLQLDRRVRKPLGAGKRGKDRGRNR